MNEKFFSELTRRLKRENIAIGEAEDERLPVLLDGQAVMWIGSKGTIFLKSELSHDQSCRRLYDRVAGISAQVHEYTTAIAAAPRLEANGLHKNFRLLADFNGVVLAGREMAGGLCYEFATWWYTHDRTGVTQGNYHYDYGAARLDFACRAGLVEKHRQFTDEQLVEMYRCVHETLDGEYPITKHQHDMLFSAAEQIERSVDDLDERVSLSNQQELDAADQRSGNPGLEMTS